MLRYKTKTNSEYHHLVNSRFESFRKVRHKNSGDISKNKTHDTKILVISPEFFFSLVLLDNSNLEFMR